MQIKIGQAIGLNTDQQAALVASSQSEKDTFLAVLKLTCDDAFTKGRQVLSELEDVYHEADTPTAQRLQEVFAKAGEKLSDTEKFDLALGVVTGKVLYFIKAGEIEVYLKRAGKVSSLSELATPKQLVSGFLTEGDRLFFATVSLVSFLGEDMEKTLDLELNEWEEEINSKIGSVTLEDQGLSGLVVDIAGEAVQSPDLNPAQVQEEQEPPVFQKDFKNPLASLVAKFRKSKDTKTAVEDYQDSSYQSDRKPRINFSKFIPKSRRGRLYLGILLIVILSMGIGYQYKKTRDMQRDKDFTGYLQTAKDDYSAAQNLSALNPMETKNKLNEAKDNLTKALSLKPSNLDAADLKKQIDDNSDRLLQQFTSANFPEFLDLNLVKKDFKASWMSLSGSNLLLLDPSSKTLVSIDVSRKSNKVLAGENQLGTAIMSSLNGNFAFANSSDKGILRVDTTNNKVTTVAKVDKDLTGVVDIAGFASNVYLLDKTGNQIWKYLATTDGYSDKKTYLNAGVKADFSKAVRMQIESSIYVLGSDGKILRYTRGAVDTFSLSGLDKEIKDPKSFFTSSDVDNIYILDSGNSRLVVVDKKGVYKAQYQGDKLGIVSDLVADEKGKKVYLLDGSKIYSMDLK